MSEVLKAPFPYPGGKATVADMVWSRIGDVDNFIEPFAGSLAVLLRRPSGHFANGYRVETANDLNCYLVNLWRCLSQGKVEEVAAFADSPVFEADLHARHRWLVRSDEAYGWRVQFAHDPHFCDPKIAGWWVWGQCCWIGSGWCGEGVADRVQRPIISGFEGQTGRGIHGQDVAQIPRMAGGAGGAGNGVHSSKAIGACQSRRAWLVDWMQRLADRLRLVRTCCGHWSRVCDSDSTLTRLGVTGVFLDPPYPLKEKVSGKKSRSSNLYATDAGADLCSLRDEVLDWCKRWGQDKSIRAAVCCYEGDGYEPLASEGWTMESWEANGGYGNQSGRGKSENAKRERIYFSPACVMQPDLFEGFS